VWRPEKRIDSCSVILLLDDDVRSVNLTLQADANWPAALVRVAVLGEILWDSFTDSTRLGGAPLNFAVHARRLGCEALLISAVGSDELGAQAGQAIEELGLDRSMLQITNRWPTGTAQVSLDPLGQPAFKINRPAAYDAVQLTEEQIGQLASWNPGWLYYGTLFPSTADGKRTLFRFLQVLPQAIPFYDVNLRPGFDSPDLVLELLALAGVVKLNETELQAASRFSGLPSTAEAFCRQGSERFGWKAVCVTRGARGCAILAGSEFTVADGYPIEVADTVGAGDAFAAAFLHGLNQKWSVGEIASFANRVGAIVASRAGAIPDWSLAEAATLEANCKVLLDAAEAEPTAS
jgi:fructokinase